MLRELFENILQSYLGDRTKYDSLPAPRKLHDFRSASILTRELPLLLIEHANISNSYKIKGSVGQGNMADVIHICLFDTEITKSAREGYYIAYLFNANLSKFYLTINQGWTEYQKKYGNEEGLEKIESNAQIARPLLRTARHLGYEPIDLGSSGELGIGYERGTICSIEYKQGKIPDDKILIDNLLEFIEIYKELKNVVGVSILDIKEKFDQEYELLVNQYQDPEINNGATEFKVKGAKFDTQGLRKYVSEFSGRVEMNKTIGQIVFDKKHGIIVDTLAKALEKLGFVATNDANRDLVATKPGSRTKIFEIKTRLTSQIVYTAIGQVLVYGTHYKKENEPHELILVFPQKLDQEMQDVLLLLNIKILNFKWDGDRVVFENLDSILAS